MPADRVVDLRIQGADQLGDIARHLKETGDKELRKELYRGIQRAAKPLRTAAQQAARENLPKRGGLNEWVASSKFSITTRGGRDPAVRVAGKKAGHDLKRMDQGRLRHPLYGNRRHWFIQQIPAGWFSTAMTARAPAVRRDVVAVLDDVAARIAR